MSPSDKAVADAISRSVTGSEAFEAALDGLSAEEKASVGEVVRGFSELLSPLVEAADSLSGDPAIALAVQALLAGKTAGR